MKAGKETRKKVDELLDLSEAYQRTIEQLSESSYQKVKEGWEILKKELKLDSLKRYNYNSKTGEITEKNDDL